MYPVIFRSEYLKDHANAVCTMTWSRENVITLLALFATCVPTFIIVTRFLLRRRQRLAVMGGRFLSMETYSGS
jgi:hypothetical protein